MAKKKKKKKKGSPKVKVEKVEKSQLNPKQREFCRLYVTKEFFGNGTEAYIEAYDVDVSRKGAYAAARSSASTLLTNPNILDLINKLLDNIGLNDHFVDKQLLFLINQHADLNAKVSGIREYNKLKNRITNRIEHTGKDGEKLFPEWMKQKPDDSTA